MGRGTVISLLITLNALCCYGTNYQIDTLLATSERELDAGSFGKALKDAYDALELAKDGDLRQWSYACFRLANAFQALNNFDNAATHYEKAMELAEVADDSLLLGNTLSTYGMMRIRSQKFAEGEQNIYRAIEIAEQLNDTLAMAHSFQHLALSKYLQGQYRQALDQYERALVYTLAVNDERLLSGCYHNIGLAHSRMGEIKEAESYFRKALSIRVELKDDLYIKDYYLGITYLFLNDSDGVAAMTTQAEMFKTLDSLGLSYEQSFYEPQTYVNETLATQYQGVLDNLESANSELANTKSKNTLLLIASLALLALLSLAIVLLILKRLKKRVHIEDWEMNSQIKAVTDEGGKTSMDIDVEGNLNDIDKETLMSALKPIMYQFKGNLLRTYIRYAHGQPQQEIALELGLGKSRISEYLKAIREELGTVDIRKHAMRIGAMKIGIDGFEEIFELR